MLARFHLRQQNSRRLQPHELEGNCRDAALPADTKTLFRALDLLERLMPIVNGRVDAFMDFCTELEELRLRGARPARAKSPSTSSIRQLSNRAGEANGART